MRLSTCLFFIMVLSVCGQDTNSKSNLDWSKMTSKERLYALTFTTPAYQKEALRLVIEEANRVARELNLPETLPITESNLVAKYISSPRMFGFGNITTSNYTYYMTVGKKFSFLEWSGAKHGYDQLRKDYLLPMGQMDTNAAYQTATQLLGQVSVDVAALNRDCVLHIDAFMPEGKNGKHFVPVYWIYWVEKGREGAGSAASVELLEPTKTVLQMHVNKSEYILRQPLQITNLDYLLSQTNASANPNAARK